MMTVGRSFQRSEFVGLQVLTLPTWIPEADVILHGVFQAFDNSLRAVKHDPDATRLFVPGAGKESPLTLLNTAVETALRSIPERHAPGARLHVCAVNPVDRRLWMNMPAWCRVWVESIEGHWDELTRATKGHNWAESSLVEGDRRLAMSFFDAEPERLVLLEGAEPKLFRTASLVTSPIVRPGITIEIGP